MHVGFLLHVLAHEAKMKSGEAPSRNHFAQLHQSSTNRPDVLC